MILLPQDLDGAYQGLLRAVRRVVGAVTLVGREVVGVGPPYDRAEVTPAAAHGCVMEAITALAARRGDRQIGPNPTRH